MNEPLSGIMSTNLITVSPGDKLSVVKDLFRGKRIHHIPVVQNGKLVGLITTADLLWQRNPRWIAAVFLTQQRPAQQRSRDRHDLRRDAVLLLRHV